MQKALRPAIGMLLIAGCSNEIAPTAAYDRDPTTKSARPATSGSSTRESFGSRATPVSLDWQQTARSLIASNNLSPLAASRVLAALGVAEYRALVAADDEHPNDGRSEFEAERGAVAAASQTLLAFFFPSSTATLQQVFDQQSDAHPWFARGTSIGQAVGAAIVTRTMNDGFTRPFTGTIPVGPGLWIPKGPPVGPTFGQVTPWLLASNSQFRPGPPPLFGSPSYLSALQEIRAISDTRTPEQIAIANYWNFPAGTFTPPGYWNSVASNYVVTYGLDERDATHTLALTQVAFMDGLIACWDAKYTYWFIRPPQADPAITTVFPLPNHPSYPSGHSCGSSAAVTVLEHLFPQRTSELQSSLTELVLSRMYAGIHYRFDIDTGRQLGESVGEWAIARDAEGKLARENP
jgi:membrane-associated phospholipid phosphatase